MPSVQSKHTDFLMSPIQRSLAAAMLFVGVASAGICQCPVDWTYLPHTNSCYKLDGDGTQLSWQQARASCIAKGGDLVSIHSVEEQALAYALGLGAGVSGGSFGSSGIWTGLNRNSAAGSPWVWSDGSPNNYTQWAALQPDNSGGQEFCAVLLTNNVQGNWNDYDCSGFEALWGAVGYGICKQPVDNCCTITGCGCGPPTTTITTVAPGPSFSVYACDFDPAHAVPRCCNSDGSAGCLLGPVTQEPQYGGFACLSANQPRARCGNGLLDRIDARCVAGPCLAG